MSLGTKPLIFLEPLSQTLKKLKEVVEENADAEGIEVFEIDALEEAQQLIPTIGQGLILTSSPKKCAMMLQQNKRAIKKLQSKTILLSPKSIPRKTLDKFMKVGLTECVVEPVNPKTLLYKVRLQLRSISTKKDEDQEMNTKFGSGDNEQENDGQQKLRAEKGVILDEEEATPEKKAKKEVEENVLDDYSKPKKKSYKEEAISGFYKNKTKKREEELDLGEEEDKKKGYKEEAIDGHYKGTLEKQELEEEEEETKKKPVAFDLEEDLDEIKRQMNEETIADVAKQDRKKLLEFEEEVLAKKKNKTPIVEDTENKERQKGEKAEDLGGHYKGNVKKGLEVEDEAEYRERQEREEEDLVEKERKKKLQLLDEEEEEKDYVDKEEKIEEIEAKKKKKKLQILDEEDPDFLDQKEEEFIESDDRKDAIKLDIEADHEDTRRDHPQMEEVFEEEDKKRDAKADEIDGYLRGGAAKKSIDLEDDEDIYKDEAQELLNEEKRKKKAALALEEDIEKDPLLEENVYEEDYGERKKKASLSVVDEDFDRNREKGIQEEETEFGKRQSGLKVEEDEFQKKKLNAKEKEERRGHNRSNAKADHIKTHYSSRESLRHDNNDWGDGWEKPEKAQEDFPSESREEKELIIENQDLGEQTIDYGQLKKEFEGISIDGIPNKKKQYGSFDNVAKIKTFTKKVVNPEGDLEDMEFEEIQATEEEQETEKVFEPLSLGMEYAIEVLNFYFDDKSEPHSLCEFINDKVKLQFDGATVFYTTKPGKELEILYNGFIANGTGKPPEKPKQEELDALTRSERKEFEDDYKQDLSSYEREVDALKKAWELGPATRFDQWLEKSTPAWLDHTFQQKENEFVFPFYEGVTLLGLAVFIPGANFNPEKADSLEALFEVARGIYLSEYHQTVGTTQQRQASEKPKPKEEKKGGFFSKIFKKGA